MKICSMKSGGGSFYNLNDHKARITCMRCAFYMVSSSSIYVIRALIDFILRATNNYFEVSYLLFVPTLCIIL